MGFIGADGGLRPSAKAGSREPFAQDIGVAVKK
jgi:hypothetical protein